MAGPVRDSVSKVECWLKTPAKTSGTHILTHNHAHIYTIHTCTNTKRQNQTPIHSALVSAMVPVSLASLEEGMERGKACVAVALRIVAAGGFAATFYGWTEVVPRLPQ